MREVFVIVSVTVVGVIRCVNLLWASLPPVFMHPKCQKNVNMQLNSLIKINTDCGVELT